MPSSPEIIVRPATESDIGKIRSIARRTWHATYDEFIPREVQDNFLRVWYSTRNLRASMTQENSRLLVAELHKEIIGFAQFVLELNGCAHLSRIYVLPEAQRRGGGRALLKDGLGWLRANKAKELQVLVETENQTGRRFYETMGFEWLRDFEDEIRDDVIGLQRRPSSEYHLKIER